MDQGSGAVVQRNANLVRADLAHPAWRRPSTVGRPTRLAVRVAPHAGQLRTNRPGPAVQNRPVALLVARLRNDLTTLSELAQEPVVWTDAGGELVAEVREAAVLAEAALLRLAANTGRRSAGELSSLSTLADALHKHVGRLSGQVGQLAQIRQQLFQLGALVDAVALGITPASGQIWDIGRKIVRWLGDLERPVFIYPDPAEPALQIAAHSLNVAQVVAGMCACDPAWLEVQELCVVAALLQDIGMIYVPDAVLESPEPLNPTQQRLIRKHPIFSASVVEHMTGGHKVLVDAVRQHHERLDASGYPEGLSGDRICSVAQLLAVVDVYVGMQSPRPYRPAKSVRQALSALRQYAQKGRLLAAWVSRLPSSEPLWVPIRTGPQPPEGLGSVPVAEPAAA